MVQPWFLTGDAQAAPITAYVILRATNPASRPTSGTAASLHRLGLATRRVSRAGRIRRPDQVAELAHSCLLAGGRSSELGDAIDARPGSVQAGATPEVEDETRCRSPRGACRARIGQRGRRPRAPGRNLQGHSRAVRVNPGRGRRRSTWRLDPGRAGRLQDDLLAGARRPFRHSCRRIDHYAAGVPARHEPQDGDRRRDQVGSSVQPSQARPELRSARQGRRTRTQRDHGVEGRRCVGPESHRLQFPQRQGRRGQRDLVERRRRQRQDRRPRLLRLVSEHDEHVLQAQRHPGAVRDLLEQLDRGYVVPDVRQQLQRRRLLHRRLPAAV